MYISYKIYFKDYLKYRDKLYITLGEDLNLAYIYRPR